MWKIHETIKDIKKSINPRQKIRIVKVENEIFLAKGYEGKKENIA